MVEGLERSLREGAAEGSRLQADSDKLRAERMQAVAEVGRLHGCVYLPEGHAGSGQDSIRDLMQIMQPIRSTNHAIY